MLYCKKRSLRCAGSGKLPFFDWFLTRHSECNHTSGAISFRTLCKRAPLNLPESAGLNCSRPLARKLHKNGSRPAYPAGCAAVKLAVSPDGRRFSKIWSGHG